MGAKAKYIFSQFPFNNYAAARKSFIILSNSLFKESLCLSGVFAFIPEPFLLEGIHIEQTICDKDQFLLTELIFCIKVAVHTHSSIAKERRHRVNLQVIGGPEDIRGVLPPEQKFQ